MITSEQFFYLNATIVTVNGLFVGALSYRQYRLAQQKLKLDLYDRRFQHWQALKTLVMTMRDNPSHEATNSFFKGTLDAEFLFGNDVVNYFHKVCAAAMIAADQMGTELILKSDGRIRLETCDQEKYDLAMEELEMLYNDSIRKFSPYLGFGKLKH